MTRTAASPKRAGSQEIFNPATGEPIGVIERTAPEAIPALLKTAALAQARWSAAPRWRRSALLQACAAALEADAEALARLLTRESGKVLLQARAEVGTAVRLFRRYAEKLGFERLEAHLLDQQPGFENDLTLRFRQPHGVVALIIPFNFPVSLLAHKAAPALAMGNAIVVKPSEETPLVTRRALDTLRQVLCEYDGLVHDVHGDSEIGEALVGDPGIAAVSFTGSTEVGKAILRQAASQVKPVMTELGGNDAMVVLKDADLELAASHAFQSRLVANGQCCCATKRVLIDRRVARDFRQLLEEQLATVRMGNPETEGVNLGPLVSRKALVRLEAQFDALEAEGLHIPEWNANDSAGAFCRPVLLPEVTAAHSIARDLELFAPVWPLIAFETEAEAVAIANQSRYGLSGSVFSRDLSRALGIARQLITGQVVINRSGVYRPDVLAFGGVKESGQAREGLEDALHEFSWSQAISLPGLLAPAG